MMARRRRLPQTAFDKSRVGLWVSVKSELLTQGHALPTLLLALILGCLVRGLSWKEVCPSEASNVLTDLFEWALHLHWCMTSACCQCGTCQKGCAETEAQDIWRKANAGLCWRRARSPNP